MKLLITEATEARILQLMEVIQMRYPQLNDDFESLIANIEADLNEAERLDGDVYVY